MKNKILLVLSALFGLMMVNSGLNKFFNYMPAPEDMPEEVMKTMSALMAAEWIIPLVAVAEIIGGILIAIPRTRALGAIVIFPVMVGIMLFHLLQAPETIAIALVLFAINIWVIIEDRQKYLPMISEGSEKKAS